ncbi:P450-derived glycosyltransferase activator, partial [Streptomyces sp. MMS24-I31]
MISSKTDSELGRELMTVRGFQWIYGVKDDPYALLLRAEDDDPQVLYRQIRERGPLYSSSAKAWVTADPETAAQALADPRLGVPRHCPAAPADGEGPMPWDIPSLDDVLPLDDAYMSLGREDYNRLRRLAGAAVDARSADLYAPASERICRQALDRLGSEPGPHDLVPAYARSTATAFTAALLGLPPTEHDRFAELSAGAAPLLDATLCPPRLPTARLLITSLAGISAMAEELLG